MELHYLHRPEILNHLNDEFKKNVQKIILDNFEKIGNIRTEINSFECDHACLHLEQHMVFVLRNHNLNITLETLDAIFDSIIKDLRPKIKFYHSFAIASVHPYLIKKSDRMPIFYGEERQKIHLKIWYNESFVPETNIRKLQSAFVNAVMDTFHIWDTELSVEIGKCPCKQEIELLILINDKYPHQSVDTKTAEEKISEAVKNCIPAGYPFSLNTYLLANKVKLGTGKLGEWIPYDEPF